MSDGAVNTLNAWAFLVFGCGMILLPSVDPALFPSVSGGSSDLWVEFMGWVNGLAGGGYLLVRRLAGFARRALAWPPAHVGRTVSPDLLRPGLVVRPAPVSRPEPARRLAA
jgi:hypothetical protein